MSRPKDDSAVFVGSRPTASYVMKALMVLDERREVTIKARGRAINHAVDVVELLRNKFLRDVTVKHIAIGTEKVPNASGKETSISTIEITLAPPGQKV